MGAKFLCLYATLLSSENTCYERIFRIKLIMKTRVMKKMLWMGSVMKKLLRSNFITVWHFLLWNDTVPIYKDGCRHQNNRASSKNFPQIVWKPVEYEFGYSITSSKLISIIQHKKSLFIINPGKVSKRLVWPILDLNLTFLNKKMKTWLNWFN